MDKKTNGPVVIGVVGTHNSGKTTVIEKLVPFLKGNGYRVGTIKHTCHENFEIDVPGKDTYRHRKAGARTVAIVSRKRTVLIKEFPKKLSLKELLKFFDDEDIVLVEGRRAKRWLAK